MKFLAAFLEAFQFNVFGGCCPNCFHYDDNSVKASIMKDKIYKDWKIWLHCTNCTFTTPAYESIDDAQDNLEDAFIMRECELFKN